MENSSPLKKTIGLPQAIALYIGAVLGSGVLIVPGLAAEIAGPASLLAWGFMTLLILPLALSMGLLSARFPNAGGVSHFVTMAFGPRTGALIGWFFLMSVPIGAPVAALTGAGYLTAALGWGEGIRILIAAIMLVAGLAANIVGMKVVGPVQIAVVLAIVAVLVMAVAGAAPHIETTHFTPFMPHGWISVGRAAAILFWCFIGWEAVSHMSEEFTDPKRAAVKGVTIAAVLVGVLYFLTALATVGTHSYEDGGADTSLVRVISMLLGHWGGLVTGFTGVFICTATIIAYTGASSRLAYALSRDNHAPRWMGTVSRRYHTPIGGIAFLTLCFIAVLVFYGTGAVSLSSLIQLPNATFILTYLGGCAAGIRLLKDQRWARRICWISFLTTALVFPFVGWAVLYPVVVIAVFFIHGKLRQTTRLKKQQNLEQV
ncbi:MAG: yecA [Paenibacillaceae bacterium]|jgi:amino acid efflux transporter|nr:yecA [Paenibacillaceae bacterium]